jgi:anti-sigma factor RsiW
MNERQQHPADEELDMLRAGLLDDDPTRRAVLVTHIEHCAECRKRLDLWRRVTAGLDESARSDTALNAALAERRRAALAAARPAQSRRAWNRALVATAASVAVSIGIGLGVWYGTHVRTDTAAVSVASRAAGDDTTDLYSNIDFYVWLGDQDTRPGENGNET